MTWIHTSNNTWWKILCSEYHPRCIIYQKSECFRCSKKYIDFDNLQYDQWKTIYNIGEKKYDEKIYCKECSIVLKQFIIKKLIKREITGSFNLK